MAFTSYSAGSTPGRRHRLARGWRSGAPPCIDPDLEFFSGLTSSELRRLAELLTVVDVSSGRSLGREGTTAREFIIVLRGSVAVSLRGNPLAVLDDGHHFGALPLLEPRRSPQRRASFHSLVDTRIAVANRREFSAIRRAAPLVNDRVCAMAERRQAYFDGVDDSRRLMAEESSGVDFPVRVEATR